MLTGLLKCLQDWDERPSLIFKLALSLASGILLALVFSFEALAFLSLLLLLPLLWLVQLCSLRGAFAWGWVVGTVSHLGAVWWVIPTIDGFGDFPLSTCLLGLAFVALAQGLQMGFFALGLGFLHRHLSQLALLGGAWWVLLEWLFPKFLPWYLGEPLVHVPYMAQTADLAGVYGLGFLLVLQQGWLVQALRRRLRTNKPWRPFLRRGLGVLVFMLLYGVVRVHTLAEKDIPEIHMGIAQSGLDLGGSDSLAATRKGWQAYEALSFSPELKEAELVVFGETVLRVFLQHQVEWLQKMRQLASRTNKAFILGSLDLTAAQDAEFNSAYLLEASGPPQIYHKQVLFPFGEYVPGVEYFDFLKDWPTTGHFVPGKDQDLFKFKAARIAPSICFEAMLPGGQNVAVRKGANVLINISDDTWMGDTPAGHQHLHSARLRAIETRRDLVRSSNSGVSAFIDASGRLFHQMPLGTQGVASMAVRLREGQTIYVRFGDWICYAALMLLAAALATKGLRKNLD